MIQALKRRQQILSSCSIPRLQDVSSACISARALQKGDYGIIYTDLGLKIGQGKWTDR